MLYNGHNLNIKDIKLVIWDLDNTFWNGVLSEGGMTPVDETIELVKELSYSGIVNSICSKNNYDDCEVSLKKLEIWDFFVFPSIDWTPKAYRVNEIIINMGLRPQNVLFLDDEPYNLQAVLDLNASILCASIQDVLLDLLKQVNGLSKDPSLKRLNQYHDLEKKMSEKKNFSSDDLFLKQSNIIVAIEYDCKKYLDRIYELVQRTNQLNFTKQRDNKTVLNSIINDPSYKCGVVFCRDKYSDYGIVGFFACDISSNHLFHFLFSCRTIGMGVEQFVYAKLGFPHIEIEGDIVTKLDNSFCPDWIQFNETTCVHEKTNKDISKAVRILAKGPCDISQVLPYFSDRELFDTEFAYVSETKKIYIESQNHTSSILLSQKLINSEQDELINTIPFIDKDFFKTNIFSESYDIIIFSLLTDYGLGMYRSISRPDIVIPFGQHTIDYTNEEKWKELVGKESDNEEIKRQYLYFKNNYRPEGRISDSKLIENLRTIRSMIPSKTCLVLLNGAVTAFSKKNNKYWLINREKEHAISNERVKEAFKDVKNVYIVDVNKYISSSDMYLDTLNHYKKIVYYEIAREIEHFAQQKSLEPVKTKSRFELLKEKIIRKMHLK